MDVSAPIAKPFVMNINYSRTIPQELPHLSDDYHCLNIEDALTRPDDECMFLKASMAFLRNQLTNKVKNSYENIPYNRESKSYSSLLIFELNLGTNIKKYSMRVKNVEQYDAVMKMEARLPNKILSLHQLLPMPKKASKNRFLNLLKHGTFGSSSIGIKPNERKSSQSILGFFKKQAKEKASESEVFVNNNNVSSTIALDYATCMNNLSLLKYADGRSLRSVTDHTSFLYGSSSGFIKPVSSNYGTSTIFESKIAIRQNNYSRRSSGPLLSKEELDILRVIPSHPAECLRDSRSEIFRRKRNNYENVRTALTSPASSHRGSTREQPSKLSVCVESDEEDENYSTISESSKYSYNLTDEVKSNFSPEVLDVIMRRILQHFDYNHNK